jgi:hypothetical protein
VRQRGRADSVNGMRQDTMWQQDPGTAFLLWNNVELRSSSLTDCLRPAAHGCLHCTRSKHWDSRQACSVATMHGPTASHRCLCRNARQPANETLGLCA